MSRRPANSNGQATGAPANEDEDSLTRFAHFNFAGGVPAQFTRKDLRHSLLNYTPESEKKNAIAIFKVILRFMGDVADYRGNMASSHQPNMGSVMTRLYEQLGIPSNERDLRRKNDILPDQERPSNESPEPVPQLSIKRKGGTLRRLKATITSRFFKNSEHSVFHFLPLEETLRSPLEQLHFIVGFGILRPALRDEIYCQIAKQLSNNPFKSSVARGWLLLTLTAGCFTPSENLRKYILKFLDDGPPMYAINCKKILQRTLYNGTRFQPPAYVELESGLQKKLLELSVTLMDGTMHAVVVDSATTARELCVKLADIIELAERFGFSLYISIYNKVASLGNGRDHVLDSISQCEQIYHEQEGKVGPAPWRLFFRKEMFSPWESAASDVTATNLIFSQVVRGIMLGEYRCDQDHTLALLAAQQYFIEYGSDISEDGLTALLPSYIPPDQMEDEDSILYWRKAIIKAHQKLCGTNKNELTRPSPEKVKQDIVHFAKTKWFMAFSRYYDVTRLEGPEWPENELTLAINWTGIYVLLEGDTVYELAYPEIASISDGGARTGSNNVIMILMVNGGALKFTSPDADDLRYLVSFMMDGLRERSTYAVSVQAHTGDGSTLDLMEGDLLVLSEPVGSSPSGRLCEATNQRTQQSGEVCSDDFYVLPTLVTPTADILNLFQTAKLKLPR